MSVRHYFQIAHPWTPLRSCLYGIPTTGVSVAKLALAVEEVRPLGPDRAAFRISTRAAQLAHRAFDVPILVYRRVPKALLFVGTGRVVGLEVDVPGFELVRLDGYRAFDRGVPSGRDDEVRDPGVRRSLSLEDGRFDDILHQAAAMDAAAPALEETQTLFAHDRQSGLDAYLKLHDRVLQRWQHRCVFTGAQFPPSATRPHPDLKVVAIRPRELGGQLHVRNYLPMVAEAEEAWLSGHLTMGSEFGFVVAERLIDPELHEKLLPLGRLELPESPALWPDAASVAYHRANIFDRDWPRS